MKRTLPSVAALGLMLPLLAACGSGAANGNSKSGAANKQSPGQVIGAVSHIKLPKDVKQQPPAVPAYSKNQAKSSKGQTIVYYGDGVGIGHDMDVVMAQKFAQQTGVHIKIVIKPSNSDQALSTYTRLFSAKSPNIDTMMLDVVWPGTVGSYLLPLDKYLGSRKSQYYSSIIKNDTINGHLIAIPWFADYGLLYYRTDLMSKYHISSPPTTWAQLKTDAMKIQTGERKSNSKFYGFVFQGNSYEGLTCDALEWIASYGGGTIVSNGKVTLNNPKAIAAVQEAGSFVGTISPRDVTTYTETESNNYFDAGNAAFLRNWPYAYAIAQQTPKIAGKVGTAPLPHGPGGKSSATVGGWQIGVSKYSKHQAAAVAWAEYLTSPAVEKWRAINGSFVPSIPSLSSNAAVKKAEPFLATTKSENRVVRPASFYGSKYAQASTIFWQGVNQVLNGSSASSVLPGTAQQLQRLAG
jgi:trehalose/maltose transport system substrate-binding protein